MSDKIILELDSQEELVIIQAAMQIMNSDMENSEQQMEMMNQGFRASGQTLDEQTESGIEELKTLRKIFDKLNSKVEKKLMEIEKQ